MSFPAKRIFNDDNSQQIFDGLKSVYDELTASSSGGLLQSQIYEIFNGDLEAPKKIASLFEQKSGLQKSVADMLMSKNNVITADLLDNLEQTLYTADLQSYVKKDLNNTGTLIKQSNVKLHGFTIINPNTYDVWLKFYDKATAPTVGTDSTINKIQVPSNGSVIIDTTAQVKNICPLGLGVAVTKLYLDSDTTAVSTNCELFLSYKFN